MEHDVTHEQTMRQRHHILPADARTVHWGHFSRSLAPKLEIDSGDLVTIEVLTHHANDDAERMIAGDSGAESVYGWTPEGKNVDRRGAGPMDASLFGRGAGEGRARGSAFISAPGRCSFVARSRETSWKFGSLT